MRTLVESGILVGERGAYRLARPVEGWQVPATVQTMLEARIDRLPLAQKQLLQAAAVIGKDVPYELLAEAVKQPTEILRGELAKLQEAEFLFETQLFPDLEYTFKHALTHEVAYGSVLRERRCQVHARILAAMEELYVDRLGEHVELLTRHALQGEQWEKAIRFGRQAGARAFDRSAARETLMYLEHVRRALQELPEGPERIRQLIDVCFDQRNALFALGEFVAMGDVLEEARALSEGIGDQVRLGWALAYLAHRYTFLGEHANAVAAGQRARSIAEEIGDIGLRVVTNYYVGQARWFAGNPRAGIDSLREVIALIKGAPLAERFGMTALSSVVARWALAEVLAEGGAFPEAIAIGEEGLEIAQSAVHRQSEIYARYGLGYAYLRRGDFADATRILEPGLVLCRELEIRVALPFVAASLGWAYLWSNRVADALPLLEEAVATLKEMGILGLRSLSTTLLAEAYFLIGRGTEARICAQQALALAQSQEEEGWQAWALKLIGDIHAREASEATQAIDAYRQALDLASRLEMRPLLAHCHIGLGTQLAKKGESVLAGEHTGIGIALIRDMDMSFWLEAAQKANCL